MGHLAEKTDYSNSFKPSLEWGLFIAGVLIYLSTRLIALDRFPIYFFTDEALHMVLAERLVEGGFQYNQLFLPTYFPIGATFGLNGITVYLNIIPYLLFGKSVFVARATAVAISMLPAIAIALTMKDIFKVRYWWIATFLLSITPTWFLHSRTAFENVAVASFYAVFVYFYLRYRLISPRSLYLAMVFGALAFYAHGLGQVLMGVSALLLFFIDIRYHWQNRKVVFRGLILIGLLIIPYLRFILGDQAAVTDQLRMRASYWVDASLTFPEKLWTFSSEYLYGFNPVYWFSPQPDRDLARHVMKGYGHILLPSVIFVGWGLFISLSRLKSPEYRILLVILLAAPVGAALAQITILRTIWMVIPITIFSALGVSALLGLFGKSGVSYRALSVTAFGLLSFINGFILWDSITNGPVWYRDYTLYGMQYGAQQVFGELIPQSLDQRNDSQIVVSSTWANGADKFEQFFLSSDQQERVSLSSIDAYLFEKLPLGDHILLILTGDEFQRAAASEKFKKVTIHEVINYPDQTPGFYLVSLEYVENIDEIFRAEAEARKALVESEVVVDGDTWVIHHSMLDMGTPELIFDGDSFTLIRGLEANPFILDIQFSHPLVIRGLSAEFANMDFSITAHLYATSGQDTYEYNATWRGLSGDPHVEMRFDSPPNQVERIRIEILSHTHGERAHIHVRELAFDMGR